MAFPTIFGVIADLIGIGVGCALNRPYITPEHEERMIKQREARERRREMGYVPCHLNGKPYNEEELKDFKASCKANDILRATGLRKIDPVENRRLEDLIYHEVYTNKNYNVMLDYLEEHPDLKQKVEDEGLI